MESNINDPDSGGRLIEIADGVISLIAQIGFVLLIYARHYLRPDFRTTMASDLRPPVVFLRSFADDEQVDYNRASTSWFDFSLESRLGDHFSSIGPFIAIGKPGDKSPHLGAVRATFSNEEWQLAVWGWMNQAALIVVMIGRTRWVDWELRLAIARGYVAKLIIVFPESKMAHEQKQRLEVIRCAFSETEWNAPLQSLSHAEELRSLAFLPGGRLVAVISSARNRESFHLAALICHDALLQDRGLVLPRAVTSEIPGGLRSGVQS